MTQTIYSKEIAELKDIYELVFEEDADLPQPLVDFAKYWQASLTIGFGSFYGLCTPTDQFLEQHLPRCIDSWGQVIGEDEDSFWDDIDNHPLNEFESPTWFITIDERA